MKRNQILAAVITIGISCTVAAFATASSQVSTPLYTVRMEQASSEMNFLPTGVHEFMYTAEKGYELTCTVSGCCSYSVMITEEIPCHITDETCVKTCRTCITCGSTCGYTCGCTCGFTCDTCVATCGITCNPTCDAITCDSCIQTCITCSSCSLTCSTC